MSEMTGRDRIRASLKGSYADRIPFGIILGPFKARVLGCSLKEYWTDPKKLAAGTIASFELFQQDSVDIGWDIVMETETAGAELEFPDESVPQVKRHILAQKTALGSLKLPNPESSGRFPLYLEACRSVLQAIKGPALSGTVTGPWTIAANLRGAQQLIYDTVDDSAFVEELLRYTTDITKILGAKIIETGLSLSMGEAASSCSLISPTLYRRFIKPRHLEIVQYFREKKAGLSLHICGYIDPIMEDIAGLGIVALSLDSPSSLKKWVDIAQKKVITVGNVPTSFFANGTKKEIEASVKECIGIAAPGGFYILSSGCELPHNSTMERVQFFVEAAKEFGKTERIR